MVDCGTFLVGGVVGAAAGGCSTTSSVSSDSKTALASASFARRISVLNKHKARSRLGRLISSSVNSDILDFSSLLMAPTILSLSEVGGKDPEGDEVLGGVDNEVGMEIGVEGCSGADAMAAFVVASSNRES